MADRPCNVCDFKGVGQLEAKFVVEGLRFAPISVDYQTEGMVILQLCRWKFSHEETLQQTLFD